MKLNYYEYITQKERSWLFYNLMISDVVSWLFDSNEITGMQQVVRLRCHEITKKCQ